VLAPAERAPACSLVSRARPAAGSRLRAYRRASSRNRGRAKGRLARGTPGEAIDAAVFDPRYGFTDRSKSEVGAFVARMIVLAFSAVRVVSTRDGSSPSSDPDQPSSNASVEDARSRPASFERDERPRASSASPRPVLSRVLCAFPTSVSPRDRSVEQVARPLHYLRPSNLASWKMMPDRVAACRERSR